MSLAVGCPWLSDESVSRIRTRQPQLNGALSIRLSERNDGHRSRIHPSRDVDRAGIALPRLECRLHKIEFGRAPHLCEFDAVTQYEQRFSGCSVLRPSRQARSIWIARSREIDPVRRCRRHGAVVPEGAARCRCRLRRLRAGRSPIRPASWSPRGRPRWSPNPEGWLLKVSLSSIAVPVSNFRVSHTTTGQRDDEPRAPV